MNNSKKIIIVITGGLLAFLTMGIVWANVIFPTYYPEEYQMFEKKQEEKEHQEILERIEQRKLESEVKKQEEIAKQETLMIEQMKKLPDSCTGVNSMEVDLYPTGKQCLEALDNRVTDWCISNSDHTEDCRTQFYLKLAETCEDTVFSSTEVCLMHTFQDVYSELIP